MKPKLLIALPTTHGVMQTQFLPGILDLFRDRTYDIRVAMEIDPYIILARNNAACELLESDCTHLMFIDADIGFTAQQIRRLVEDDVDIVGGLYPKKTEGRIQWVSNALSERPQPNERGLLPVKHLGTGFMLIKRGVFEKMLEVYRDEMDYLEAEVDTQKWDFFPMRIVDRRYVSEDWFFCDRARACGYTVYADTRVILRHIGTVVFPLKTQVEESHRGVSKEEFHKGQMRVHNAAAHDPDPRLVD